MSYLQPARCAVGTPSNPNSIYELVMESREPHEEDLAMYALIAQELLRIDLSTPSLALSSMSTLWRAARTTVHLLTLEPIILIILA